MTFLVGKSNSFRWEPAVESIDVVACLDEDIAGGRHIAASIASWPAQATEQGLTCHGFRISSVG